MREFKETERSFYLGEEDNKLAEITFEYEEENESITITGTYVDPPLRNQGIGRELVDAVVKRAVKEDRKVGSSCSFAEKILVAEIKYLDIYRGSRCCDMR